LEHDKTTASSANGREREFSFWCDFSFVLSALDPDSLSAQIIVVGVYVTIHSLFLFVHVATLSVAVNSADNALLTLLISGNFAEIKSTVFKVS